MQAFDTLDAIAVPMDDPDIDTDQIVPARFMHKSRVDYGRYCFHDLRFQPDGTPVAGFVLNRLPYRHAQVLVANRNFACGSSREHAVYTLQDFGFRAVIAPSFGDIFFINCFKNGVLPIEAPTSFCERLRANLHAAPGARVQVDLTTQRVVAPDGDTFRFEIDPFRKDCLLRGLDEIDLTLSLRADIERYEARHRAAIFSHSEKPIQL